MFLISFIKNALKELGKIEDNLTVESKFSQNQLKEIMQTAKSGNLQFFHKLSSINGLSAFDLSYILSSVDLDLKKVDIIERAIKLYKENEFNGQGQTLSDYVFKVAANINLLNEGNLDVFKELAQCRSNLYDFSTVLKNPSKYINKNKQSSTKYCFSTVLVD